MVKKKEKNGENDDSPMIIKDNKGEVLAQYDRDIVDTIKNTVAKNATDSELYMFLKLANEYDLDVFKKEIWFIKYKKDDPQIFTSRDGFVKIAKKDRDFKQIQSNAVYENDEFEIEQSMTENGFEITSLKHKRGAKDRGKVLGAYCVIEYHTKKPLMVYADYKEYASNTPTWRKNASAMIKKVAEKNCCKLSAGISGLYIPEEMPSYYQKKTDTMMSDEDSLQKLEAEAHQKMKEKKDIIDVEIE